MTASADPLLALLDVALGKGGADAEAEAAEYVDALERGAWVGVPELLADVDDVEVGGCVEGLDGGVEVCADDDAEFFTVYLRRAGEAQALWDLKTRAAAARLARLVELLLFAGRSS